MKNRKPKLSGIQLAVKRSQSHDTGTQASLADAMGCKQQTVGEWVARGYAPWQRAVEIEALTGVPRRDLVDPRLLDSLDTFAFTKAR